MQKPDRTIRPATPADKKTWDTHTTHPLQSWSWGAFRMAMGIEVTRIVEEAQGNIQNVDQLTFHKIPHMPWTIGYFPKGSIPTPAMIDALVRLGKQKRAIFIQLEPNVNSEFRIQNSELLRLSHHPLFTKYTFVLDLTKSEETLLAAMSPKTRYNIRVAQKHHVTVQEDDSPAAFAAYLALTRQTTGRQGFYAHDQTYHRQMWKTMHETGIAHLFTATYQKETLAAWIVFIWHDTVYYPYGASSRDHRDVMAPTLLLWEIARWAKTKNLRAFDLWGAMGPNPDPNDPWYGFHRFKQGFAPQLVESVGSYDLVINPTLYKLYTIADQLRWAYLKSKF